MCLGVPVFGEFFVSGSRSSSQRNSMPRKTLQSTVSCHLRPTWLGAHVDDVSTELKQLAAILAAWSIGYSVRVYLFGSRVRGDHKPSSDVDVYLEWLLPGGEDVVNERTMAWWQRENEDDFRAINRLLPGKLQILEGTDPIGQNVMHGAVVYRDGNVWCVKLPPK